MPDFNDSISNTQIAELRKRGEEKLMQSLAPQYGYDYIDLHGYTLNPEALTNISEADARAAHMVAFELNRKVISVATNAPNQPATNRVVQGLQNKGYTVALYLCSNASLEHAFARYADHKSATASKRGVLDINPEDIFRTAKNITTVQDVATGFDTIGSINSPRRISETLELIFAGALALKASDIHIEPEVQAVRLRYRLDGVLLDIFNLEQMLYGRIISRLKLLAGMTLNQRKEAQDGRFQFNFGEREIEVRASIIPGSSGESMVMRLLDPGVASFSMDKLQLNPLLLKVMQEQLKRPNGLIITTGPTGSGKTTALYAFLRAVHDSEKKIITIENPVEYKLDGIVQTQVGPDYSFSSGLRAILRQDPDIIMIGEIRDREVAETAIHAAQTGHLVFSTLHTNSAVGGFPRLIDLGVDSRIIGSSVNIMLGQRLARVLCKECKSTYEASERETALVTNIASGYPEHVDIPSPLVLYKSVGCPACGGTGYKGRCSIFEAVVIDNEVEEAVIRDPREHIILAAAEKQNIPTMAEDGIVKVLEGITSLDELERVVDLSNTRSNTPTPPTEPEGEVIDDFASHIV
ncbi:type II/IV secretion system protein [Patescibacteria group bacterium]|nr:type II/IV secretion system protein [Patescibacteria group bacterium]